MIWLGLMIGFFAGTIITAGLIGVMRMLDLPEEPPPHPERQPLYDWEQEAA